MSKIRNTPPHGHGSPHNKPGQQQQPHRPGVAQPKIAGAQQPRTPPPAPPVYRPQPGPKCLQAKMPVAGQQGAPQNRTPTAPAVYRPQPAPRCLQPKVINRQQSQAAAKGAAPVAPAVYRPGPVPKVLQTKQSAFDKPARVQPTAPPAQRDVKAPRFQQPARPAGNNQVQLARAQPSGAGAANSNNVVQRTIWKWNRNKWQVYRQTETFILPVHAGTTRGELYDDEQGKVIKEEDVLKLHQQFLFQHGIEKHVGEEAKLPNYNAVYKEFRKTWTKDTKKQINRISNQLPKDKITDKTELASVARILYAVHPGKGNVLDLPANAKPIPKMAGGFKTRNDFLEAERTVWNLIGTMSLLNIKAKYQRDDNIEDEADEAVTGSDAWRMTVKWKSSTDKDKIPYTGILVSLPVEMVWPKNAESHLFGRRLDNKQISGPNIYPKNHEDMKDIIESGFNTKPIDYTPGGIITALYRDYEQNYKQKGRHLTTMYVRPVERPENQNPRQGHADDNEAWHLHVSPTSPIYGMRMGQTKMVLFKDVMCIVERKDLYTYKLWYEKDQVKPYKVYSFS